MSYRGEKFSRPETLLRRRCKRTGVDSRAELRRRQAEPACSLPMVLIDRSCSSRSTHFAAHLPGPLRAAVARLRLRRRVEWLLASDSWYRAPLRDR